MILRVLRVHNFIHLLLGALFEQETTDVNQVHSASEGKWTHDNMHFGLDHILDPLDTAQDKMSPKNCTR